MNARAIMTPNPRCVATDDPISAAARLMADLDVGMLPVVVDFTSKRLAGVITDRDIAIRHVAPGHVRDCAVEAHMSGGPLVVAQLEEDVHDVMALMEQHQVRRLPVVNERGAVVGVISCADIALRVGPLEPSEAEKLFAAVSRPDVAVSST